MRNKTRTHMTTWTSINFQENLILLLLPKAKPMTELKGEGCMNYACGDPKLKHGIQQNLKEIPSDQYKIYLDFSPCVGGAGRIPKAFGI
ncbi:hypothetical protein CEXT_771411 [Caerostris extrusa]|uniref:Uncharacterized protein n=1 Tax=Caerostris extrusa TaxID=172846 RepID=A0AAV4TMC8_CAEEX|nr:hypothetical protein CEXT_771411 [Caerostris extrusa]